MATGKTQRVGTGVVILAAGASSRLGRPKQLLPYNDKTLLQHAVNVAQASSAHPVVIVLGAAAEAVQKDIRYNDGYVVLNSEWEEGMASSVRCGVKAFMEISPAAEGVIIMVCDQPFVTPGLLNDLIAAHQKTTKPVVACGYAETFGPPVFFHHTLFAELLQVRGDMGARGVVRQHADAVTVVPFPEGRFDVDTEADFEQITRAGNGEREL